MLTVFQPSWRVLLHLQELSVTMLLLADIMIPPGAPASKQLIPTTAGKVASMVTVFVSGQLSTWSDNSWPFTNSFIRLSQVADMTRV